MPDLCRPRVTLVPVKDGNACLSSSKLHNPLEKTQVIDAVAEGDGAPFVLIMTAKRLIPMTSRLD
jgi:hypothetical protein